VKEFSGDPNVMNDARETPFLIAAREGKIDIIRLYLDSFYSVNRFEVDHKMLDGWTAV
jgi:ankyrin repeat protein